MDSIYQQRCVELEEELERMKFSTSLEIGNLQDEVTYLQVGPTLTLLTCRTPFPCLSPGRANNFMDSVQSEMNGCPCSYLN